MKWKEVAKFASGVTAWEAIVHTSLALGGNLPFTWLGFTLTPTFNTIQIILSVIISIFLASYAWGKR
jgi:hypothetical protein